MICLAFCWYYDVEDEGRETKHCRGWPRRGQRFLLAYTARPPGWQAALQRRLPGGGGGGGGLALALREDARPEDVLTGVLQVGKALQGECAGVNCSQSTRACGRGMHGRLTVCMVLQGVCVQALPSPQRTRACGGRTCG